MADKSVERSASSRGRGDSREYHSQYSSSEYEEDMFPEKEGSDDEDDDDPHEKSIRLVGSSKLSSLSGSSFHTTNSSKSHRSVEVTPAVWARTWEDRVKQFQQDHPEEYANIARQMKRRDIWKIEEERSQRIYENKIFKNVDRFVKIVGGAACAMFCCSILLVVMLAVILKPDKVVSPAPTPPPVFVTDEGVYTITSVPPKQPFPTIPPAADAAEAPTIAPNNEEEEQSTEG